MSFKYKNCLGCHAKYIVCNGEITHKAREQARNQTRGAKRSKLVERMLKEKLTPHDVHIVSKQVSPINKSYKIVFKSYKKLKY